MSNPRSKDADTDFNFMNESNDCSVRATSIALGKPYKTVHEVFKKHGRKWGKGVTIITLLAVLKDVTKDNIKTVASDVIRKHTLATFIRENPKGKYVIVKSRHAFAVIDGVAYDAHPSCCTSRSIVKFAFKLGE
jgi:hypothetical protein